MTEATHPDREDEQRRKARILDDSQTLDDYTALAHLLSESPGREDEGWAMLQQALELAASDIQKARLSAEGAWLLYELGWTERAVIMARRALSHIAEHEAAPDVLMFRGISHATLAMAEYSGDRASSERNSALALECLERLLGQYPEYKDFVGACSLAAGVYVLREEHLKAAALYEEVIRRNPSEQDRLDSLVCLGNALRCQGRYAEGETRLREALSLAHVDKRYLPRIYFELGKGQRLSSRSDEALAAFQDALAALEFNPALQKSRAFVGEVKWELGNLYYDAGRHSEAIPAFREALPDILEVYPYLYCHTLISLGHCYLVMREYGRAHDCYEEVLASEQASSEEKAVARDALSALPPLPPPRVH